MKNAITILFVFSLLLSVFSGGCAREAKPEPGAELRKVDTQTSVKATWETEWAKAVAEGKKEGSVVIYTSFGPPVREALQRGFKEKYGIETEWVAGLPPEFVVRARSERSAGLFTADVFMSGVIVQFDFKKSAFLDPLETAIILPEVKDPKAWDTGMFPIRVHDKDGYFLAYLYSSSPWVVNTEMLRPEEVSSYQDLLNPRLKGKIVLQDPSITGSGETFVSVSMWEIMGEAYVRAFAMQEPVIMRDARLATETVARGKYPMLAGVSSEMKFEFQNLGAPLKQITPNEGIARGSGHAFVSILNRCPHPNAAKVFINWLLTKEGQTAASKGYGAPSRRLDVPTEFIDPERLLIPGRRYVEWEMEEMVQKIAERRGEIKKIFGIP